MTQIRVPQSGVVRTHSAHWRRGYPSERSKDSCQHVRGFDESVLHSTGEDTTTSAVSLRPASIDETGDLMTLGHVHKTRPAIMYLARLSVVFNSKETRAAHR